jgi:hypothetical protein
MVPLTRNHVNNPEDGHTKGNEAENGGNTIENQHLKALTALEAQLVILLAMGTNTSREGGKTSKG